MRKILLLCALLPLSAAAEVTSDDSLSVSLDEVLIETNTVSKTVPMAMATIDKKMLHSQNKGQDLPWMLQMTPSLVVTSDNGLGIGLTSFRIRGTDASRINLTYDGVALNDPEDQTVFWANMTSFANSVDGIQIQRGVGSSTNGSGAFGASVSMQSQKPAMEPTVSASLLGGSYGTYQYNIMGSSGLLDDHWTVEGRYSQTFTDGYIDRTAGNLRSHNVAVSYFADNWVIQLKNFGSQEHTGQAWNGVPSDSIAAGNRTYNSLGEHLNDLGQKVWQPTTDNYTQNNTQLSIVATPTSSWSLHGVLHHTYGKGYYDDYKANASYYLYRMDSYADDGGTVISSGDLVRQKWLQNNQMGLLFDARYHTERIRLTTGASCSLFNGTHWGEVSYAKGYPLHILGHYYDSDAHKIDAAAFAKAEWQLSSHWLTYADLQYRFVDYHIGGTNDKYHADHTQQHLDIHERFPFFNPKVGISYRTKCHNAYTSFARTHREPTRNNYTDAGASDPLPTYETLNDWETGYNYQWTDDNQHSALQAGFNLYHMGYVNQLIQTGRLSDIGEALTVNVGESYRRGIELMAGFQWKAIRWDGNCTLSQNRINNFSEWVDNWEGAPIEVHYDQTDIAFSPSLTAASDLGLDFGSAWGNVQTQYVGRQYLDNTRCLDRSLAPYCVTNLQIGYRFSWQHYYEKTTDFELTLHINNLFNAQYATGGWVYTAVCPSNGFTLDNRYREDGLFVQAPLSAYLSLAIKI